MSPAPAKDKEQHPDATPAPSTDNKIPGQCSWLNFFHGSQAVLQDLFKDKEGRTSFISQTFVRVFAWPSLVDC
jgi:hypothetical protein